MSAELDEDRRLIEAAREHLPHLMRKYQTPGLSIAVGRRGRLIWEEGFGLADVSTSRPMAADIVFRSGSIGKVWVATAVMQLVERGVIDIDEPLRRYLPDVPIDNPHGAAQPTVLDFLTHRSGLRENYANCGFTHPQPLGEHLAAAYARARVEDYDAADELWARPPGETMVYSNLGMATLGFLVEVTNPAGLSFSDYVQQHIVGPLGLTSTCYPPVADAPYVAPELLARLSTGYATLGPVRLPTPPIWFADYPAGGMLTTGADQVRLLLAYLGEGELDGQRILEPETVRRMLSLQLVTSPDDPRAGVGVVWFLGNLGRTDEWFGHGGAHMYGWHNDLRAYPGYDLAVCVATNQWNLTNGSPVVWVGDFLVQHIANERRLPDRPREVQTWAWKASYVIGLMMADLCVRSLGVQDPLTPAMVDAMVAGAHQERGEDLWDEQGFRAGLADLSSVGRARADVEAFLSSDRLRVPREELDLLWQALGGVGQIPLFPLGHRTTFASPTRPPLV